MVVLPDVKRFKPLASFALACSSFACSSTPPVPVDLVVTRETPSGATFENNEPLVAGSIIEPGSPLVLAYTVGRQLSPHSAIAIVVPTSPPDEPGAFWSVPSLDDGEPGFVSLDEESSAIARIERAGRVDGGGGQIEIRTLDRVEPGTVVRVRLSGNTPRIVPRRPLRLYEVDPDGVAYLVPPGRSPVPPVVAAPAVSVSIVVAPDVVAGQPTRVRVAAFDAFGNVDTRFAGTLSVSNLPRGVEPLVQFNAADLGQRSLENVRFTGDGVARLEGTAQLAIGNVPVASNPFRVWRSAPAWRRFVGDPHFHTGSNVEKLSSTGGDVSGQFVDSSDAFRFLREDAALDWGASTEYDFGLSAITWADNQRRVEALNDPGRFVTLLGYEWTPAARLGHHTVLFGDGPEAINPLLQASSGAPATVSDLVAGLRASKKRVLAIPHVTQPYPNEDDQSEDSDEAHEVWDGPEDSVAGIPVFNDIRRVGEIYSRHNHELTTDGFVRAWKSAGEQPELFETDTARRWTFRHAWAGGHRVGVVAGSDNRVGTPGLDGFSPTVLQHGGLTVVLAKDLTRKGVFDALHQRRCYATTGARIWLDLTVDGHPMGSELVRRPGAKLVIAGAVAGTGPLESAEIVIFDGGQYSTLAAAELDGTTTSVTLSATKQLVVSTFVYLRIRQRDGEMAWSSPIWIDEGRL
jgi:hypothetical protein